MLLGAPELTNLFQSTPPRREVTDADDDGVDDSIISIHTSPKGGDNLALPAAVEVSIFQSTPPRREVTDVTAPELYSELISIHTSPKGGDIPLCFRWCFAY